MNFLKITFLLLLSFLFSDFSFSRDADESILATTYALLPQNPVNNNIHELDLNNFDQVFPPNAPHSINNAFNRNAGFIDVQIPAGIFGCGGMRSGSGSGIIIAVQQNGNMWDVEGLTALHVLGSRSFQLKPFGFTGFRAHGQASFIPGQHIDAHDMNVNYSSFRIHGVRFHDALDICLFSGQCFDHVGRNLNAIQINNGVPQQNLSIVHYPTGDLQQRLNNGQLTNSTQTQLQYQIDTLPGSSGSPILDNAGVLCGIHTSGDTAIQNQVVSYYGRNYNVVNQNKGVLVNQALINYLQGRPLVQM